MLGELDVLNVVGVLGLLGLLGLLGMLGVVGVLLYGVTEVKGLYQYRYLSIHATASLVQGRFPQS